MIEVKKKVSTSNNEAPKRTRATSGTAHPYFDLDSSIKVSEVIHSKGGGAAAPDQLAAWLGYKSVKSGTYLTRIAAAKQFGLIQSAPGGYTNTERAQTILSPVMPDDSVKAKVEAFLDVDLFSKAHTQYRGAQLPPEVGLKNLFQTSYKILPDRVPQAVRVFLNSAEQAGFFLTAGNRSRLVSPATLNSTHAPQRDASRKDDQPPAPPDKPKGGGGGDGPPGVHSAIIGLLRELPAPGTPWSAQKKERFLGAFKATVDFIYPEEDVS